MVFFIFVLVLMFSLSGVLYLMVRALPRVADIDVAAADGGEGSGGVGGGAGATGRRNLLDRWAHSQLPEKIDETFNGWLLKFLRKFKVFTLKLDNMISTHLRKIHNETATAEKKSAIDFKEISGQNKEDQE
jgi:hypothetical protein